MRACLRLADETDPLLDQSLPRLIRGVCLAGDDQLYRPLRIAQQAQQSLSVVQQQVRSLVGREAASKAKRQCVGIK